MSAIHRYRLIAAIILLSASIGLAASEAASLPAAESWPSWRGPYGNGSAGVPRVPLVDSISKARLVWRSEVLPSTDVRGDDGGVQSGYASPIVVDGRVYLFYYHGDGKTVDGEALARFTRDRRMAEWTARHPPGWLEQLASTSADEVIHCLDAASGQTLWKTVYESRGLNIAGLSGKCGGHYTLCHGDGRIYAIGSTKRIYALDATSGEKLWEGTLDDHERLERLRAEAERSGTVSGVGKRQAGYPNMVPAYADGVVVFGDGGDLHGFHGATGKPLWGPVSCGGSGNDSSSPLRWHHQGRDFFLGGGNDGVVCIEPRSGTVLWRLEDARQSAGTFAVSGEYLVCRSSGGKDLPERRGLSAWQISPQGARALWQLPPQYTTFQCSSICIHAGVVWVQCELNSGLEGRPYDGEKGEGFVYIGVDLQSGTVLGETPARGPQKLGKNLSASIVAVGGFVLDVNAQRVFRADPGLLGEGLYESWVREMKERIPTPAIVGTRIYIRDVAGIHCYELAAGR